MKNTFKNICFFCFVLCCVTITFAQKSTVTYTGKVIETVGSQPIAYATVMVADQATKKPITGTTTLENGSFVLETSATNFYIEVAFIGFKKKVIQKPSGNNKTYDLGSISLSEDTEQLDEVILSGEISQTEFKLDKRVFNVAKDLSSVGASALEVLNNVPSVNVSIEGEISLRGSSGVQILINGKPSAIANENTLGTLTADMISRIEVITNPSAKYDAEGTSGILNIVLKKDEKKGLNGSVTLNTGVPKNHSVGLSLNRRTEKFNLFSQVGLGSRIFPEEFKGENRDRVNNTSVINSGDRDKYEDFFNLILGTDYHINKYNVVTLSGNFAYEKEKETANTLFNLLDASNTVTGAYERIEKTTAVNPKYQYELLYKKDYENNEDRSFVLSATGQFFGKDQESVFNNEESQGTSVDSEQTSRTDFKEAEYIFKADYTHPFAKHYTIETGAQYQINDVDNDYAIMDGLVVNPEFSNVFSWSQNVLGVYGTTAYEQGNWGLKLGLRLENTDVTTVLEASNQNNNKKYTNLFPSGHTSYKINDNFSLQAGYSKRIFRPRMWNLNPFVNIRNSFSVRTGNPNLLPEYTDSFEVTSINKLGKATINLGVFYRHTTDVVERITVFEDNISTSTPENIGTNDLTGIEFNAKFIPSKWFVLSSDFNYSYFNRKGEYNTTSFDFKGNRWSARLNSKIKLPADVAIEFTGNYQSAFKTVQQEVQDNLYLDMGVRKKIFKGKAILSLSVRDVFASRVRESITNQTNFYLRNYSKRGSSFVIGLSYGFGKGEAMEFSGRKHR